MRWRGEGTTASSSASTASGPGAAPFGRTSSLDQLGSRAVDAASGVAVSSRLVGSWPTRSMKVCPGGGAFDFALAVWPVAPLALLLLLLLQPASPARRSAASATTRMARLGAAPVTAPV